MPRASKWDIDYVYCYGLSVCMPLCSYVEALTPIVAVDGASKEVTEIKGGHKNGVLISLICGI